MKKFSLAAAIFCCSLLFLGNSLIAQNKGYHAMGAKVLFVDFGYANGVDSLDVTNALELQYLRNFNKYLSFAVPVKIGVGNLVDDINNRTIFSIDGIFQLQLQKDSSFITPYIMAGGGWMNENFEEGHINVPVGLGANLNLSESLMINIQAEFRQAFMEDRNNAHLGLGMVYKLTTQDTDKDGVPDSKDECPNQAGPENTMGCPDSDMDGIRDSRDKCPTLPGKKATRGCPDTDGDGLTDNVDPCPNEAGDNNGCPDTDEDGIHDGIDKCPDVAGVEALMGCPDADGDGITDKDDQCPKDKGTEATQGCPDTDMDGILDKDDRCPNEAGVASAQGCPDADADGIADADDRCPNKAGDSNGCPDTDGDGIDDGDDRCPNIVGIAANKGCPEIKKEEKEKLRFAAQAVRFETGKSTLKIASYNILNDVADIMKKYAGYRLRIAGHTDSTGNNDRNLELSKDRAEACYDYLVSQGINANRMVWEGYGETVPIASNKRSAGRRKNRRVEFDLFIE